MLGTRIKYTSYDNTDPNYKRSPQVDIVICQHPQIKIEGDVVGCLTCPLGWKLDKSL